MDEICKWDFIYLNFGWKIKILKEEKDGAACHFLIAFIFHEQREISKKKERERTVSVHGLSMSWCCPCASMHVFLLLFSLYFSVCNSSERGGDSDNRELHKKTEQQFGIQLLSGPHGNRWNRLHTLTWEMGVKRRVVGEHLVCLVFFSISSSSLLTNLSLFFSFCKSLCFLPYSSPFPELGGSDLLGNQNWWRAFIILLVRGVRSGRLHFKNRIHQFKWVGAFLLLHFSVIEFLVIFFFDRQSSIVNLLNSWSSMSSLPPPM